MSELHRAQILLTRLQYRYLRTRAKREGSSVSAIVRDLIQAEIEDQRQALAEDPFWEIVGMVAGGDPDAGLAHDHYIYGTPRQEEAET